MKVCFITHHSPHSPLYMRYYAQSSSDFTALLYASENGHLEVVKYLVANNADYKHKAYNNGDDVGAPR